MQSTKAHKVPIKMNKLVTISNLRIFNFKANEGKKIHEYPITIKQAPLLHYQIVSTLHQIALSIPVQDFQVVSHMQMNRKIVFLIGV